MRARQSASSLKLADLSLSSLSRPVYPYSIIRGGAYSAAELESALDRDPVAARHYLVFQRSRVHTTTSPFTAPVYLSYRVGEAVYWTSRPVPLPSGETLLSDGQNYARARCGNRISEKPQTPVSYTEPAPTTLDEALPAPPRLAGQPIDTWSELGLITQLAPPFAPESPPATSPTVPPSGPILVEETGTTPAWWIVGPPGGLLSGGETPVSPLSPNLPSPPVGGIGSVIQPNPIPGYVPPFVPQYQYPSTPQVPPIIPIQPGPPTTGPVIPPVIVPPVSPLTPPSTPVVPETPGVPGVPGSPVPQVPGTPVTPVTPVTPETPGTPGGPGTPPNVPNQPVTPVVPTPEPALLTLVGLALAGMAAKSFRRRP